eukprot:CAMPEP_0206310000 /NCGR_PEP_ID=MMETSP0106_2-20121207/12689_1 /ASSEMBLY_ACC=CAM_ASM_000206 /TAXON_ID=81532 /ORGANISM="Acanthoeca-like sp., Strain 10tr" /LENGTH=58 /DNA_ID=CAMNT_0053741137 /DNA_START=312 /DNA_END=488 /DNA_ORIENTATION=+
MTTPNCASLSPWGTLMQPTEDSGGPNQLATFETTTTTRGVVNGKKGTIFFFGEEGEPK